MPPVLVHASYNLLNWRTIAEDNDPARADAAILGTPLAAAEAAGWLSPMKERGAAAEGPKLDLGNVACLHVSICFLI
jgi:hypothetical protein